jgi:hypothetical protein
LIRHDGQGANPLMAGIPQNLHYQETTMIRNLGTATVETKGPLGPLEHGVAGGTG